MDFLKKHKITIIVIGLIAISWIILTSDNNVPTSPAYQDYSQKLNQNPSKQIYNDLSNDNYYTNSYGNIVHSPAYSSAVPIGATAKCRDGTYSFSQSRRGTCSHHGGVANWL